LNDEAARDTFEVHGISDLWLSISKQTARRLLADSRKEKVFLNAQDDMFDAELKITNSDSVSQTTSLSHASIEDDEELVGECKVLGEGAYGVVEEVTITTKLATTRCVRKRIRRPKHLNAQKQILTAFASEVSVMRQVRHHHCVRFLGSYTDPDHVNIISLPAADMDLATFLDLPITDKRREVLYREVSRLCNTINYLHHNNIRHQDLKPQNVLIYQGAILLTDFGFSLDFSNDSVSTTTGRPSA
jgi:hypothetical protein